MRMRLIAPLTAALVAGTVGLSTTAAVAAPAPAPAAASAARTLVTASAPISQTIAGVGSFTGSFRPTGVTTSNGQVSLTGLVTGTLTDLAGARTPVSQAVSAPIAAAAATGSCTILDLTLGPLHLNLLGLVVDLNQVHLVITAVPGPGNLLGNLLCAVANLLNGGTGLGGLSALLNQLLGLLGGL
jgi:hypothetical protein